ncbi:response regulator [Candidatus Omnitrophota bacterium]
MMGKKILIVDDDVNLIKMMKPRLEANNFEVVTAHDGEEGLSKLESEKPDLLILDIVMPKVDGYTFLKEMKSRQMKAVEPIQPIPVIVLTGQEKMQDLFEIEGIKEYVVKPFEGSALLEKIKKHLS